MHLDIVVDFHHKDLDKMAAKLSWAKGGLAAYIGSYKKAFQIIEEGLDEETRVMYQAEAKKWSEHKPPPWQQQQDVMPTVLSDPN
jgi:hypothetical protein